MTKKNRPESSTPQPKKAKVADETQVFSKRNLLIVAGIILVTLLTYWSSNSNEFTNWDDPTYVTENPMFSGEAPPVKVYFQEYVSGNYHPLTMWSLGLDYSLNGMNPRGYHYQNLFWHLLGTFLVFFFILRLSGQLGAAAFTAIVFGIHPMHVESVAWISERKDVLYGAFFFLGLFVYLRYLEEAGSKKWVWLILVALAFVASMLSKAQAVVFPVVLVLIDLYKKRPVSAFQIAEKVPFFVFSVIMGLVAVSAQKTAEAISDGQVFALWERVFVAGHGLLQYWLKFFVPIKLSNFYPYPDKSAGGLPMLYLLSLPIVLGGTAAVLIYARKNREILFGLFFFFLTIALVLQVMQVGSATMADRYTYLPYVGFAFMVAQVFYLLPLNLQKIMPWVAGVFCLMLAVLAYERTKVWENSDTLWTNCIKNYPEASVAWNNRGNYWGKEKGDLNRALPDYEMCIKVNPNYYNVYINRGNVMGLRGNYQAAIADYSKALELKPGNVEARLNRGISNSSLGKYDLALEDFSIVINNHPTNINAYGMRGYAYYEAGKFQESVNDYNRVLQVRPGDANAWFYRGLALYRLGNLAQAISDYDKVLQLNPNYAQAYQNRSLMHNDKGNYKAALEDAKRAQALGLNISQTYIGNLERLAGQAK